MADLTVKTGEFTIRHKFHIYDILNQKINFLQSTGSFSCLLNEADE